MDNIEIILLKNEKVDEHIKQYKGELKKHFNYTFNRDFMVAIHEYNIIGIGILYNKEKCTREPLENVITLTNIIIDESYKNKGVATAIFNNITDYISVNNKILRRTSPTEDGSNYIFEKFTNILENKKINYIPHNLDFIYEKLERDYFKNKRIDNYKKIDILNNVSKSILKNKKCIEYKVDKVEKLSTNFLDESYDEIEKYIKNKNKNKFKISVYRKK